MSKAKFKFTLLSYERAIKGMATRSPRSFPKASIDDFSPSCHIQYGKRFRTYNLLQTGEVEFVFEDNSESAKVIY
ncbi:hypothetical protein H0H92_012346 [Tricholoma furcatifolium]|nr:hypothetical protein H0H92_012346 [Tricholoma furcatifolium]